ncbi:MAG: DUF4136 domain-containing protein [Myxococcota bacterium]|nr:DUF4136 domain-containing protein [Myxococcota bacterium]
MTQLHEAAKPAGPGALAARGMAALLPATLACAVIQVSTDSDPSYRFEAVETFAVQDVSREPERAPGVKDQVRRSIEANLAAKGYVPDDEDGADLIFTFAVGSATTVRYSTHPVYWEHWGGTEVWSHAHDEGRLVIDCVDARRQKVVWHGYAHETLYDDMDDVEEVAEAVDKILARFPSRGG